MDAPPSSDLVSSYNADGFLGYLPNLNTGRFSHGCGHFINGVGNQVNNQIFKKLYCETMSI